MSLSFRIFFAYTLFVAVVGYFVLNAVVGEIKPAVRQATEETLVDTANVLAEILKEPLKNSRLSDRQWANTLSEYGRRSVKATIWGVNKTQLNHRIYVTDEKGVVLLDSTGQAVGQDYSHWNDVYLTLQGKYGARSTADIPGDEYSSVMYVAAPILDGEKVIGVVSVSKPNRSIQPYIDKTLRHLYLIGGVAILLGLSVGIFLSWWLTHELRNLRRYALSLSSGQKPDRPENHLGSGELKELAQALTSMRSQLDGKAYIERYVQTLTHELKSPLAGIHAAVELLSSPMADADRVRFLGNIKTDSWRMQALIERLLDLSKVEQQQTLERVEPINLHNLWCEIISQQQPSLQKSNITVLDKMPLSMVVMGDVFLLKQAFTNLIDNAIDFTPLGGEIVVSVSETDKTVVVELFNPCEPIPEAILQRVTERFFSMPRPLTGKKSTGLGLNFVQEVAVLHNAVFSLSNVQGGVQAALVFAKQ